MNMIKRDIHKNISIYLRKCFAFNISFFFLLLIHVSVLCNHAFSEYNI